MITEEYSLKQFNQFLPMIEKATWHYSRKYRLDRNELQGQGYLIFCEALERFDEKKASFSTYLFNELSRLNIYCKEEYRHKYKDIQRIKKEKQRGYGKNLFVNRMNMENIYCDYAIFNKVLGRLDYEISLSNDAKEIVTYILSRDWENVEINWKPRFSYIQKRYLEIGWTQNRVKKAWREIKEWWASGNKDQFCMEV